MAFPETMNFSNSEYPDVEPEAVTMADFLADAGMQAEIWNKFKFTKERAQNVVDMINEILFQKLAEFAESLPDDADPADLEDQLADIETLTDVDVDDTGLVDDDLAAAETLEDLAAGGDTGDDDADPDAVEDALQSAAAAVVDEPEAPAVAIGNALDAWFDGLSATSQKSLTAKKRMGGLKDLINTAVDGAASALEKEVLAAVDKWRGEHEETLIKSKRFAKKNFDSLGELIPQIAVAMLQKTSESNARLTRGMVHKTVYRYLDKKFKTTDLLFESTRWQVLAGIRRR